MGIGMSPDEKTLMELMEAAKEMSGGADVRENLVVVKIGGNVIDEELALRRFLEDFAKIEGWKILIHGGGKIATRIGDQLGIHSKYIQGRRITDDDTIDLVTMVYGGLVNKKIVAQLQALHCNAIGLTGSDANIIPASKRPEVKLKTDQGKEESVDFGWVGDISQEAVGGFTLFNFISKGLTPVLAPLTHDAAGHLLNTNADTIASVVSVALSKYFRVRLVYCFEKKGVLENVEKDESVIKRMDKKIYEQLRSENKLFAGILPKIDNAFAAINAGVDEVLIGHADDLLKNVTADIEGTLIR